MHQITNGLSNSGAPRAFEGFTLLEFAKPSLVCFRNDYMNEFIDVVAEESAEMDEHLTLLRSRHDSVGFDA